jgi:hypothetical protein
MRSARRRAPSVRPRAAQAFRIPRRRDTHQDPAGSLLLTAYAGLLDTLLAKDTPRDVGAGALERFEAIAGELHPRAGHAEVSPRGRPLEETNPMGAFIRLVIDERVARFRLTSEPTGVLDELDLPPDGATLPPWRVLSANGRRARTH